MQRNISIAGGGLAGLTLGVLLRRAEVPVELWDAGSYPRHRVCGEFISGRGLEIIRSLELPEIPEPLGIFANSVRFFHSDWSSGGFRLPQAALSIDRARLDHALANEFRKAGGILHENQRWTGTFEADGVVRATGRRPAAEAEPQFAGFKLHAHDLELSADLEVHFSDCAYVGLSRQKDGTVNVCGLFQKAKAFQALDFKSGDLFRQVLSPAARERFGRARFDTDSFSAVAGVSLKRETSRRTKECRIGDSICMIPPLTGNGMSLALESACLAAPVLRAYSQGDLKWGETRRQISHLCDRRFRARLISASLLQTATFAGAGRRTMMYLLEAAPCFFRLWFRLTR